LRKDKKESYNTVAKHVHVRYLKENVRNSG